MTVTEASHPIESSTTVATPVPRSARSVPPLARNVAAELIGTAFLVAGVVGSGIMAQRLTTDPGLQLLQNAIATAAVLIALILALGPASGAHFNPLVTLVNWVFGGIDTRTALAYVPTQIVGAVAGSIAANVMFSLPAVEWSQHTRTGGNLWFSEGIATLGLLLTIFGVVRSGRAAVAPFAVGGYVAGAYAFTSSTSFANPAVTIGRAFTDTFAGVAPASVPMFIVAQLVGAAIAIPTILLIYPRVGEVAGFVLRRRQKIGSRS